MSTVRVVTDSASDLPEDLRRELDIRVVPLRVRIDDREYVDRVDLSNEEFWEKSQNAPALPQTSAPSVGDFEEAFRGCVADGATAIICVTLSSELSATFQSATIAAKALEGQVEIAVVDSRTASLAEAIIAVELARLARDGEPFSELFAQSEHFIERSRTFGTLDTLENLKKGGRIGPAQAMIGSLLSFKPIIEVANGVVQAESRQRTRTRALEYLADKVASFPNISHVGIMDANAVDVAEFIDMIRARTGTQQIILGKVGPVIGTHAGPRTIGITFWTQAH
ncbi:MAG: DegV family protein [Acidimicrobiales bacterium]